METTYNYEVITGWDRDDDIFLVVKENNETKLKKLTNIPWYFVIKREDFDSLQQQKYFNSFSHVINKIVKKATYCLIYCAHTLRDDTVFHFIQDLKRKNIETYEADFTRTKRFVVDNNIKIASNLKILYFDIETDDSNVGIEIGRDQILSWAAYNNEGKSWFVSDQNEKEVLNNFIKLLSKHDICVGWNSEHFDLPYIQARMKHHNLFYNFRQKVHIDLMKRCIKMYSYEMEKIDLHGFSLDEVSRVFLKKRKIQTQKTIKEMFDTDKPLLREYNKNDAKLLLELDRKLELTSLIIKECVWTNTLLDKSYVGELVDNYIIQKAKQQNEHLKSKPTRDETLKNKELHISGGYVKTPITGLYDDVRIFDFSSLYPSIIISWNIGFDSINREISAKGDKELKKLINKNEKIENVSFKEWYNFLMKQKKLLDPKNIYYQTANNNFFHKNKNSFIPSLLQTLIKQRVEMKKKLKGLDPRSAEYGNYRSAQAIVKELSNSMYGIHGDRTSRYFDKNIAEAITLTGQFLIKTTEQIVEKKTPYHVIYADTDSCFVPLPGAHENSHKIVEQINKELTVFLNDKFQLKTNIINVEYEKAYQKMIALDKKKYSGRMIWLNNQAVDFIFSKGLEDVKRNTILISKKKLGELVRLITYYNYSQEQIKKWVEKLKNYVFDKNSDIKKEDLVINTRLSKPTHKYKTKTVHVKLAEQLIKKGLLLQPNPGADSWGTRINYIITTTQPAQTAIHVDDFKGVWDRKYYWDTLIYAPICRVLKVVWPDYDWPKFSIFIQEKREKQEQKEKRQKELITKKIKK